VTDTIELHGCLLNGQACKLALGPERFTLEIAIHDVDPQAAVGHQEVIADPLTVSLVNGKIATLKGNYPAGHRGHLGADRAFVLSRIGSNQVLVGSRPFDDADLVDAISFQPTNELLAQYYVAHRAHVHVSKGRPLDVDQLFSPSGAWGEIVIDAIDGNRLTMCEFEEGHLKIALRILISELSDAQGTRSQETRLTRIEYGEPVNLNVALRDIMSVINFFSFVVGEVINPTSLQIESGSQDGMGLRPTFEFHSSFRQAGARIDPEEARRCLISQPVDDVAYTQSLRVWMERHEEWGQSYYLGSESLSRQNEISRHRYLDAVGWFESIPLFYQDLRPSISSEIIREAAKAAREVFHTSGVDVSESRLRHLLAPLNAQSLAMRLRAAMAHIRSRFGDTALPPGAEGLISGMSGLRGRLAHGENPLSPDDGMQIYELTLLVETVCRFLTLSALPWSVGRLDRAHGHPMKLARLNLFHFEKTRTAAGAVTRGDAGSS
jgi:hypothetical protein